MTAFTFLTGPECEDRASINMYGTIFTVGQAVEVTSPMVIGKLRGMPSFFKEASNGDGRGSGARALKKVGLAPIAQSARPLAEPLVSVAAISEAVLRSLGVNQIALAAQPAVGAIVTVTEIAARALRLLGINPRTEGTEGATSGTSDGNAIATAALRRLAVTGAEETPAAADLALALEKVTQVHMSLCATNVVGWTLAAVPSYAAAQYEIMAAALLASSFGLTAPEGAYAGAETSLRLVAMSGADGQALAVKEVTDAHQVLNALGMVPWAASAIPEGAASHYAVMAAARLAPALGKAADDVAYAGAIALIRQFALSGRYGQALAEAEVIAAHSVLDGLGYVSWTTSTIPQNVRSLAQTMATVTLSPAFGKASDMAAYAGAVDMMRVLCMSGPVGQAMAEQKIVLAHFSLAGRGIARWTLHDIPVYAEEPYVMMAAELLAPDVRQPPVTGMWQAGEDEIRRVVMVPSAGKPVRMVAF